MNTSGFSGVAGLRNKKKPVNFPLPRGEMLDLIQSYDNETTRKLAAQLYLFGQRIGEATRVCGRDLSIEEKDGGEVLIVMSHTEKNRSMPFRQLPIRLDNPIAKEFADWAMKYEGAERLYPYSKDVAYQRITERGKKEIWVRQIKRDEAGKWVLGAGNIIVFPHYFRHACLTHKRAYEKFDIEQLRVWAGWSSYNPATIYLHLDWSELLNA